MSLPREHKKSQSAWLDLAVFAGVLSFLGYSLHAFLGTREVVPKAVPKRDLSELSSVTKENRAPASQASTAVSSTEVLRLPCIHSTAAQVFASNARLLQIHAPFCQDDEKHSAQWRASNETSGEEIMVFVNAKEKTLSTNYFSLKDGSNELVFVQDLGKGRTRVEKMRITRNSVAE